MNDTDTEKLLFYKEYKSLLLYEFYLKKETLDLKNYRLIANAFIKDILLMHSL